jgi:hypothetical protein
MVSTFQLAGGNGSVELLADGSMKISIVYLLGIGVQLLPGTVVKVEEIFRANDKQADQKQLELMALAEKWKTGGA